MNPITLQERINNCIAGIDVISRTKEGSTTAVFLKRTRDLLLDCKKALETSVEDVFHD